MRLEWLPQALHDFNEIIDFITVDDQVAAIEQGDEIESQVAGLLNNRHLGRQGRVKGTRELVVVFPHTLLSIASKRKRSRFSGFSMAPGFGLQGSDPRADQARQGRRNGLGWEAGS